MAKAKKNNAPRAPRLGAADWVQAGLITLARNGVANVRIERLARDLKVTKGSFYWHFSDRNALLDAMLAAWRERSSAANRSVLARHPGQAREQILGILRLPQVMPDAAEGVMIELAIRLWSRRDERVRAVLQEQQRLRHELWAQALVAYGVPPQRAPLLAILFGSVLFNLWTTEGRSAAERDSLIEATMAIIDGYAGRTSGN